MLDCSFLSWKDMLEQGFGGHPHRGLDQQSLGSSKKAKTPESLSHPSSKTERPFCTGEVPGSNPGDGTKRL